MTLNGGSLTRLQGVCELPLKAVGWGFIFPTWKVWISKMDWIERNPHGYPGLRALAVRAIKTSDNQVQRKQIMTMGNQAGLPQTRPVSVSTSANSSCDISSNASSRTVWSILFRRKEHLRVPGRQGLGLRILWVQRREKVHSFPQLTIATVFISVRRHGSRSELSFGLKGVE